MNGPVIMPVKEKSQRFSLVGHDLVVMDVLVRNDRQRNGLPLPSFELILCGIPHKAMPGRQGCVALSAAGFFSSKREGNTMACDKSARTKLLRPGQILSVKAGQDGNR